MGPQVGGNATSPLHSRGSPKKGGHNQNWWGPQVGGNATSPLHSRGSPTKGTTSKWAHKWAEMLHHPCILGGPQRKGGKIRIGGAHKWAEMLHHPCILGGPQQRGQHQSGPTSGRKCYITPAFSGVPKERGTKSELAGPTSGRKCYITPAFSGVPNKGDNIKVGPQVGGNATSPLHSRGSPKKGGQNQNWRGPQVGGNATSPLHSWGSPKKGGQNQNWMPNPCLLGGPQVGRNATSPLHSRGSPTQGTKSKQKKKGKKQIQKLSHGVPDPTYSPAD